jgi:hypothetical protein
MSTDAGAQQSPEAAVQNAARQAALKRYVGARSVQWRVSMNGPLDQDRALDYLRNVAEQMSDEQSGPIKASLEAGTMSARRLVPRDGVVFESPQGRVFAIDGLPPLIAPPKAPPATQQSQEQAEGDKGAAGG